MPKGDVVMEKRNSNVDTPITHNFKSINSFTALTMFIIYCIRHVYIISELHANNYREHAKIGDQNVICFFYILATLKKMVI